MTSGKHVKTSAGRKVNLLFTCVGRRVALVQAFRRSAEQLGLVCTIVGTDINPLSPALYVCDRALVTHSVVHEEYISELLSIIKKIKST